MLDSLGKSDGRSIFALSTASLTFDLANSISVPDWNSATIVEYP